MKKKFIILFTVVGLMSGAVFPVSANSECDPERVPDYPTIRYAGWGEIAASGHTISAVGARLEMLTPHVEPFQGGSTSVWIALGDLNSQAYVQAGYLAESLPGGTTDRYDFVQWRFTTGSAYTIKYAEGATDSLHDFQILRNPSNGWFTVYRDSVVLASLGNVGFTPEVVQIADETQNAAHQFFGGTWDYEDVDLMRYAIDGGAYIDYGESSYTFQNNMNTSPILSQVFRNNNVEPWPTMSIFDWDCH